MLVTTACLSPDATGTAVTYFTQQVAPCLHVQVAVTDRTGARQGIVGPVGEGTREKLSSAQLQAQLQQQGAP